MFAYLLACLLVVRNVIWLPLLKMRTHTHYNVTMIIHWNIYCYFTNDNCDTNGIYIFSEENFFREYHITHSRPTQWDGREFHICWITSICILCSVSNSLELNVIVLLRLLASKIALLFNHAFNVFITLLLYWNLHLVCRVVNFSIGPHVTIFRRLNGFQLPCVCSMNGHGQNLKCIWYFISMETWLVA